MGIYKNVKHGQSSTPTYWCFIDMHRRCNNKSDPYYHRYGGRGISVCERWNDFRNFFADMGEKPTGRSIDRINNDGNYSPDNCRWATSAEQSLNRANTKLLVHEGLALTVNGWNKRLGFSTGTIRCRILRGDRGDAIFRPIRKKAELNKVTP